MNLTPDHASQLFKALGLDPDYVRSVTLRFTPGQPIKLTVERQASDCELERAMEVLGKPDVPKWSRPREQ